MVVTQYSDGEGWLRLVKSLTVGVSDVDWVWFGSVSVANGFGDDLG